MDTFYFKTYGCKLNESDGEIIRAILSKEYKEVFKSLEADFIVLNTCGVIDKTEQKIIKETINFQAQGKKVFWSGCLPLITDNNISNGSIGPNNVNDILKAIKKEKHFFNLNKIEKANLFKCRREGVTALVAISEGCLGNCSYCGSKFARKALYSFRKEDILQESLESIKQGFKEILLTSQGLATYGLDQKEQSLPELISEILAIKYDFKLRLGMMSPFFAKKIFKKLLFLFENKKLYKFIHLPVQSGSDKVLKEMNRYYTISDFLEITAQFRKIAKDTILATDIIVGHPKETEEDFQRTIDLIKEVKPDVLHVFRYSNRKGTKDSKLKDLPLKVKKERSKKLIKIFQEQNLEKNKEFLNKEFEVLVVREENNSFLARMNSGRAVVLKKASLGEVKKIKITDYKWNYLIGE